MKADQFVIVESRFRDLLLLEARIELLFSGVRFGEGPAWFGGGRYLIWSDIPNDRLLRWDDTSGAVSVFRQPANNANGNTLDREGRLVTCEQLSRCITRTEYDGTISVLADRIDGRRFNSPCDVVVKSDGSIWFSDADYGIRSDWEGAIAKSEVGSCDVYRIDGGLESITRVASGLEEPNGLAFSADERFFYVADSGVTNKVDGAHHLLEYAVADRGLASTRILSVCDNGFYDGLCVDVFGNIWASAGDGVHCLSPDGALLGKIFVPDGITNLCFGGLRRNRLFLCGPENLWSLFVNSRGTPYASILAHG